MTYTWGIDIYSGSSVTFDKLQKLYNAGARILVNKCSMGFGDDIKVEERINWAKQIGFVYTQNNKDGVAIRFNRNRKF